MSGAGHGGDFPRSEPPRPLPQLRSSQNDLSAFSSDSLSSGSPNSASTTSSARVYSRSASNWRPQTERSRTGSHTLYPTVALDLDFPQSKNIIQRVTGLKGSKIEAPSQKKALKRLKSEPCLNSWESQNIVPRGEILKNLQQPAPASAVAHHHIAASASNASNRSRSDSLSLSEPSDSFSDSGEDTSVLLISDGSAATAVSETLVLREDETGARCVSSGTLDRLVAHLADDLNTQDKSFIDIFLKTHRYFIDSVKLVDRLMDRFFAPLPADKPAPAPTTTTTTPAPAAASSTSPPSASRAIPHSSSMNALSGAAITRSSPPSQQQSSGVAPLPSKGEVRQLYIQLRLVNVLKHWIEHEPQDFDHPDLRAALMQQLARMKSRGDKYEKWASHLQTLLGTAHPLRVLTKPPKPILPKESARFARGDISFLDLHPLELARQLTLLEFKMFASIRLREYHKKAWAHQGSNSRVIQFIERFNKTSYWVASEILLTPSPKQRITVLSRFIEVAKHLDELNNFNGVMEILSALSFSFIKRLRNVWKEVPSKLMKVLKRLDDMMDQAGSYRNYRLALAPRQLPLLPFQGVYLTDLTFIEEKLDRLGNGHINFEKMWSLHKVFSDIQRYQQTMYPFEEIPVIQEYLADPGLILTEDQLWSHSKKCEPSLEAPGPTDLRYSTATLHVIAAEGSNSSLAASSHTPPSETDSASASSPRVSNTGSPARVRSGMEEPHPAELAGPFPVPAAATSRKSHRHHRTKKEKKDKRLSSDHAQPAAAVAAALSSSNRRASDLKRTSSPAVPSPLSAPPAGLLSDAPSIPLPISISQLSLATPAPSSRSTTSTDSPKGAPQTALEKPT